MERIYFSDIQYTNNIAFKRGTGFKFYLNSFFLIIKCKSEDDGPIGIVVVKSLFRKVLPTRKLSQENTVSFKVYCKPL